MNAKEPRIPVMELFGPTIQGEGLMSGTVSHFLRTGGCGLRCVWCDSMHAVDPARIRAGRKMMTIGEIITAIMAMPYAPYITLTGGDPCLHQHLGDIVTPVNAHGVKVAVETQGELFPDWLKTVDVVTFSPKGPSSGNVVDWHDMVNWIESVMVGNRRAMQICIKVVIMSDEDLAYAMEVYNNVHPRLYDSFYFTACTPGYNTAEPMYTLNPADADDEPTPEEAQEARAYGKLMGAIGSYRSLADRFLMMSQATMMNYKVHVGCQQHVLIWPEYDKGV